MLTELLPPPVIVEVAEPWMWETPVINEEEIYVSKAVDKRKREFRAGRHCAHKALQQLGIDHFAIKVGLNREPLWPRGVSGTITHCHNYCAAAVVLQDGGAQSSGSNRHLPLPALDSGQTRPAPVTENSIISIGMDVESVCPLKPEVLRLICTKSEIERNLKMQDRIQPSRAPDLNKLTFSAKESIHKAYFPLNNHSLDFLDAEIEFDLETQSFTAHIIKPENNPRHPVSTLYGRFRVDEQYAYTAIIYRTS